MSNAKKDANHVSTMIGVSSVDGITPTLVYVDPTTHRVLADMPVSASSFQKDTFTSTNGQTTFTPTKTVSFDFYISINGAIQTPSTDYSLIGGNYVLNSGIPSGNSVILCYLTS